MAIDSPKSGKLFVGAADRLFVWVMLIAFVVSALTATGILDRLSNTAFITFLGRIIPSIDSVSYRTSFPATARVTFSVEWLFLPIYFVLMCAYRMPFKPIRPDSLSARRNLRSRAAGVFIWALLADWNVLLGPSLYRGSVWQPDFALTELPYLGRPGLALAAFATPVVEAFIYWLVPTVISAFFISSFLPVRGSQSSA